MTRLLIASLAGLVAGLSAAPEAPAPAARERVAVVADASGPGGAERVAAARSAAAELHAEFRAPRTLRDQLSVTTLLAAEGYTTIVGYGLEDHVAIEPFHGRLHHVVAG